MSWFLTSWSSMLLEQRMSVAQPLGCSCREVMQFPRSLSPGISGVRTSRLFLGERPARKKSRAGEHPPQEPPVTAFQEDAG